MTGFDGFRCIDCGTTASASDATRCEDCGGVLDAVYGGVTIERDEIEGRSGGWRHREFLPFVPDGIGEGETPLIGAPTLAEELDVDRLLIKNEAHNPTGSVADRGMALLAEAADRAGADTLTLATTGDDGQSAAAYAGRRGLLSRVFVPSRSTFVHKAMINVHGGDMRVVEGRYGEAKAAYEEARTELPAADEEQWFPAGVFESPYRHEGLKPLYYEIVEAMGWAVPDAIVAPVGHGALPTALWKAAREFDDSGLADETPRLYAAQPEGCAPIAEAILEGRDPEPWAVPDTVVGSLEVPDPAGGAAAVEATRASGGGAVTVSDDDLLDSTATVAQHEGLELSVASGTAAAATWRLRESGELSADDTVVVVNTATGNKDADLVRSRLMGRGM